MTETLTGAAEWFVSNDIGEGDRFWCGGRLWFVTSVEQDGFVASNGDMTMRAVIANKVEAKCDD